MEQSEVIITYHPSYIIRQEGEAYDRIKGQAAADFAAAADETWVATYLRETADNWNANIERWIYVTDTDLARDCAVAGYYVRLAPADVDDAGSPAQAFVPIKNRPPEASPPDSALPFE